MNWRQINRSYKKLQRIRGIAQSLIKNGFHWLIDQLDLGNFVPTVWQLSPPQPVLPKSDHEGLESRIRKLFEELGPSFVKLGQILSVRPDLLPESYIIEFKKLQTQVKPLPFAELRTVLAAEIPDFATHFTNIDETPLGSGSIAQVHRARLKGGEEVVLKVQKPLVREIFTIDFDIIQDFAELLDKRFPELENLRLPEVVLEFRTQIRHELDFRVEAYYQERLRANCRTGGGLLIARVHPAFTTERVVVSDYLGGITLQDYLRDPSLHPFSIENFVHVLTDSFFQQVLVHGLFHADPHPGNIKILPDQQVIALLDCGFMGRLSRRHKILILELLNHFIQKDVDGICEILMAFTPRVGEEINPENLAVEIEFLVDFYHEKRLEEIQLGQTLMEIIDLSRKYQLVPPPPFVILAKAIMTLESYCRPLAPKMNLILIARPYIETITGEIFKPAEIVKRYQKEAIQFARLIPEIPRALNRLMHRLDRGKFRMETAITGIEELGGTIFSAANRMAFSLIISSLILASSFLLVHAANGIQFKGYPLFAIMGLVGYLLALFLGFALAVVILRRGQL